MCINRKLIDIILKWQLRNAYKWIKKINTIISIRIISFENVLRKPSKLVSKIVK